MDTIMLTQCCPQKIINFPGIHCVLFEKEAITLGVISNKFHHCRPKYKPNLLKQQKDTPADKHENKNTQ